MAMKIYGHGALLPTWHVVRPTQRLVWLTDMAPDVADMAHGAAHF